MDVFAENAGELFGGGKSFGSFLGRVWSLIDKLNRDGEKRKREGKDQ
jgi:hypothetical protein